MSATTATMMKFEVDSEAVIVAVFMQWVGPVFAMDLQWCLQRIVCR